jgi:hypothetical protein
MTIKSLLRGGAMSVLAATAIVASATSASAYIACNRWHQCWHVRTQYDYPTTVGIQVYPDTWRWSGPGWRWAADRDDRGYWWRGHWRRF